MAFENPPAFPCEAQPDRDNIPAEHDYIQTGIYSAKFPGMTLRDWFASQALAGILAANAPCKEPADKIIATSAYLMADAMLAERTKARAS